MESRNSELYNKSPKKTQQLVLSLFVNKKFVFWLHKWSKFNLTI